MYRCRSILWQSVSYIIRTVLFPQTWLRKRHMWKDELLVDSKILLRFSLHLALKLGAFCTALQAHDLVVSYSQWLQGPGWMMPKSWAHITIAFVDTSASGTIIARTDEMGDERTWCRIPWFARPESCCLFLQSKTWSGDLRTSVLDLAFYLRIPKSRQDILKDVNAARFHV